MYEGPIKILEQHFNDNVIHVLDDFRHDKDEVIYKAIVRLGVVVNKEELIKALQYDRQQYQKGYEDAVKEFSERVKKLFDTDYHLDRYYRKTIDDVTKEMVGENNG